MPDKRRQMNKRGLEDAPPLLRLVLDPLQTMGDTKECSPIYVD